MEPRKNSYQPERLDLGDERARSRAVGAHWFIFAWLVGERAMHSDERS